MYGQERISYPYIEWYNFYTLLEIYELPDLRAHMHSWNTPQDTLCFVWTYTFHDFMT